MFGIIKDKQIQEKDYPCLKSNFVLVPYISNENDRLHYLKQLDKVDKEEKKEKKL